jgi:hypothetical protein
MAEIIEGQEKKSKVEHNCVADPLKETVILNLDFIKEMMKNWWGNVLVDDAITTFTEKLRFDKDIKSLDSYIKALEHEILFQKTIQELKDIEHFHVPEEDADIADIGLAC